MSGDIAAQVHALRAAGRSYRAIAGALRIAVSTAHRLAQLPPPVAPKSPANDQPAAPSHCAWTDSNGRPWVFCQQPRHPGSMYCLEPRRRCYHLRHVA